MRTQPCWPLKKSDRAGVSQATLEVGDSGLLLSRFHRFLNESRSARPLFVSKRLPLLPTGKPRACSAARHHKGQS
eukprot:3847209-Amphidinium_carterae.2